MKAANDTQDSFDDSAEPLDLRERSDSLVGRIANEVARAISTGELRPGDDLNSVELAARFGTSRTPVREALMLLEQEGLVEVPPRRRPRVAEISLRDIEELYAIRSVLNGLMISLFARRADCALLEEMVERFEEMKRHASAGRPSEFYEARRALHGFWAANCGNDSLRSLLGTWKMRLSVGRLVGHSSEDVERSLLDHERLVIACREGDEPLAVALMKSMTMFGLETIRREYSKRR